MQGLFQWWNLIFLLPLLLAIALLLVGGLGGISEGDSGDGAHGGDAGDGAIHEVGEAGHGDVDGADAGDGDGEGDNPITEALHWAGVGVVPFTLLLAAFFLFFGLCGLAANQGLRTVESPEAKVGWAIALALLGGLVGMLGTGAVARRFIPRDGGPATGNKDLIGRPAKVVFAVTTEEGTIQVRDASGTVHQVAARVPAGHAPIDSGRVLVISFDAERGVFIVDEDPTEALG